MTASAATVTIPAEITVRLYDAGNNRIESYVPNAIVDVLAYGGEYALEPTSATSATDATGRARGPFRRTPSSSNRNRRRITRWRFTSEDRRTFNRRFSSWS